MITVRTASIEDAEAVARLADAARSEDRRQPARFTADAFRRDGFGSPPAFHGLIAEEAGEPVGYAVYYTAYDTDTAQRGVYVCDIFVSDESRERGAGTLLMSGIAAACRAAGGRFVFWSVLKRNRAARRFYRKLAPELKDVIVCAALGRNFDLLADRAGAAATPARS